MIDKSQLIISIYEGITRRINSGEKLLTILIDPDKFENASSRSFLESLLPEVSYLFVGGSSVENERTEATVRAVKAQTSLPVVLFPGDYSQLTEEADAVLFLTLISGRNPEYLIEQQVKSVSRLRNSFLEIIPVGYILIDGGKECAVQRISGTRPIPQEKVQLIMDTALAGQYSGKKLIYLEAGSGAAYPVSEEIISRVKSALEIPLIVGGGIRNKDQLNSAYAAGADMVVIGTAFEKGEFL
jgi:putative glycerol-1-phosphate prenyltransferase